MNEQPISNDSPANPTEPGLDLSKVTLGCTLRSKRGATAKVVGIETKQGSKDRKPYSLKVIIFEAGKVPRDAKLLPFALSGWEMWKSTEQTEADEAAANLLAQMAPAAEPASDLTERDLVNLGEALMLLDEAAGVPVEPAVREAFGEWKAELESEPVDSTEMLSIDDELDAMDPRDAVVIRQDYERELYAKLDAEDIAELNTPDEDLDQSPYDVVFAEPYGEWIIEEYRNGEFHLTHPVSGRDEAVKLVDEQSKPAPTLPATWQDKNDKEIIEQLLRDFDALGEQVTNLEEQLEAGRRVNLLQLETTARETGKLRSEITELEEQLEAARDTRNRAIDTATEASSHAAQLQSQVVELENQVKVLSGGLDRRDAIIGKLREYITELEGQRYVDPSVPLCKKYQVERDLQKEMLEKMEREGWTAEHMQFTETGSLHAVYSRFVSPPPAPQPEHTTHQDEPVNPAYTILGIDPINPVVDPTPAEIALQEAELIEARADAAEKTSPLPRFTRQGFMKDAWEASMNAAAQVVQNRNPAYDAIFNRPNALPAVAVRPS